MAINILFSGVSLIRKSVAGLMDKADPTVHHRIEAILKEETNRYGIRYHELKHRNLGSTYWVEVHLLFPGEMPIREAHRIASEIENRIENEIKPSALVSSHLESIEDHGEVHIQNRHHL